MLILSLALAPVAGLAQPHLVPAQEKPAPAGPDSGVSAAIAFNRLASLLGEWEGKFADGRRHTVSYRLTAAGSVLVETWALKPGRESMTLYHLDGDALLADHYCPQGNTPRLRLSDSSTPDRLSFVFLDGTNLQVKDKAHQHAFWIKLDGPDAFVRSETYVENGSTDVDTSHDDAVTYTRIAAAQTFTE
jgi:hypothetical protein